jgi:hypothetical protein
MEQYKKSQAIYVEILVFIDRSCLPLSEKGSRSAADAENHFKLAL